MRKRPSPAAAIPTSASPPSASAPTPGRYADGNGLYLVVDPSGAKRWIWRGIIQGKRWISASVACIVTLSDARDKALDCRRHARAAAIPTPNGASSGRPDLQGRRHAGPRRTQ